MGEITIQWADRHLAEFQRRLVYVNEIFPRVIPQTINQVGNRARTQVVRNLTQQTGLPRKTIVKAVNTSLAGGRKLSYEMATRGGNIRLKYLKPRESLPGVMASPWGRRQLYPGTFMKGGKFPSRKLVQQFDGHVWRRLDTRGRKLTQVRSGMFIPTEMMTGMTRKAFEDIAAPLLKQRVEKVLMKLAP